MRRPGWLTTLAALVACCAPARAAERRVLAQVAAGLVLPLADTAERLDANAHAAAGLTLRLDRATALELEGSWNGARGEAPDAGDRFAASAGLVRGGVLYARVAAGVAWTRAAGEERRAHGLLRLGLGFAAWTGDRGELDLEAGWERLSGGDGFLPLRLVLRF
jgi:hypothetical protein